jgi:hypothetical protein
MQLEVNDSKLAEYNNLAFVRGIRMPLSELSTSRMFELPPRHIPFAVLCSLNQLYHAITFFESRKSPWIITNWFWYVPCECM